MFRMRTILAGAALAATIAPLALADPGKPNFSPSVYGDGKAWGTKGAATIPGPNGHNEQSFDKLFVFMNAPTGQIPVAEAAPGNPNYNGGRWFTHTAIWTQSGMEFYMGNLPVLTSYGDIMYNVSQGFLMVTPGSPAGGPPPYFECPLLPVK